MVIEASEPHQGQTKLGLLLMLLLLLGSSSFLLVVEISIHKVSTMSDTDRQNGKRLMDMFLVEELLYFVVVVVVDLYVKGGEASHDYSSLLKHMI